MSTLPDYLTGETEDTIRQRMLDSVSSDLDKSEGGYIWDALSPTAIELALAAIWAQEVLRRGFAQTTFGAYLRLRCDEAGVIPHEAAKATGRVTFSGTPDTVIPAGITVSTQGSESASAVFFTTAEEAIMGQDGMVATNIQAVEPGTGGNVPSGAIKLLERFIPGVTTITNTEPTTGGINEESDGRLLERYLKVVRKNKGAGSSADYKIWAKEVPGVGYALPEPLWQGPGTVRVIILDWDGNIPSSELVSEVQEYLDPESQGLGLGKAPIGAKVTVEAPIELILTIILPALIIEGGYLLNQAKINLETAARAYILSISPGGTVRIKDIEAAIASAAGVLDFGDILVNGARQNIILAVDEKVTLLEVIYT